MYRKNTAGQFFGVQLLLTATGAPGTGLSPAARRCLDGTFGAGGGTFTEDGTTGGYKYAMSQADSNANNAQFWVTATGCIPVCINFTTTAADPTNATTFGLTNLDAAVSTRASQTSVDTIDDFLDTEVAAIKAKTDNLPSDPADASDIAASFGTVNTALTTIDDFLDTEIAAIKAKTDNLPAAPAATGDIPTANQNADALLDRAAGVETNRTIRQAMRIILSACGGKASGLATTTAIYRDTNDTKDRITATVDADGNRSSVTLDAT